VKAKPHWTRPYMRIVALKWREYPCEAHLNTAIWWRDFPQTYGKTTQTMGSSDKAQNDTDTRSNL
jgi:hypothetical protein